MEFYNSEDVVINFTIKDASGTAVDLSNKSVTFILNEDIESDTTKLEVDATGESADGTCKVSLTSTQTDITPKKYYYQLKIVDDTSGDVNYTKTKRVLVNKNVKA